MNDTNNLTLKAWLEKYFDLNREKENEEQTIEQIRADVEFKGARIWILICAIFIASIGLNMNSTAVIIGAMLISPLMGPIIGLGLGLGIVDYELVKRSLRNFAFAVIVAILTSTLYFFITPISTAQSEILARTQPTVYDLFIALLGGVAGIVAGTTRSKGQVIPGVAIATALMPPLCTAGYGLGTGQMSYFFGALYLFVINTVFIGLATYVVVKILNFRKVTYVDPQHGKRINRWMIIVVLCTAIPSVFLASQMIRKSIEEQRVASFVKNEMIMEDSFLLHYEYNRSDSINTITASLIGKRLEESELLLLQKRLSDYGLRNTELRVKQGYEEGLSEELRHSILSDLKQQNNSTEGVAQYLQLRNDSLQRQIDKERAFFQKGHVISTEVKQLFDQVSEVEVAQMFSFDTHSMQVDTVPFVRLYTTKSLSKEQERVLRSWLSVRFENPEIIIQKAK